MGMQYYDKPIHELIKEFILNDIKTWQSFSKENFIYYFLNKYPKFSFKSIERTLVRLSVNDPNRKIYRPSETDGFLWKIDRHTFRLFNKEIDKFKERKEMIDIKIFLEDSVYYPACAFDGTPIKFLGNLFSNFVYADYYSDYNDLEREISRNGLLGYKLINSYLIDAKELFGINWEDFIRENNDIYNKLQFEWNNPFAKIYFFERRASFGDYHGKKNIELLYIKAEGISTYKYLYEKNKIAPKCLVSIVPGLGFGGNFDDYPKMLIELIKSKDKLPQYQFFDDQCANDFFELIKYYNKIDQYNYNRPDYNWSTHFTLTELK